MKKERKKACLTQCFVNTLDFTGGADIGISWRTKHGRSLTESIKNGIIVTPCLSANMKERKKHSPLRNGTVSYHSSRYDGRQAKMSSIYNVLAALDVWL